MSSIDPSKHLIVSVATAITTVVIEAVSNSYVIVLPCLVKSFDKLVNIECEKSIPFLANSLN